jgi:ribosomal protein S18
MFISARFSFCRIARLNISMERKFVPKTFEMFRRKENPFRRFSKHFDAKKIPSGDFRNVSTQRKSLSETFEMFRRKENPFWRLSKHFDAKKIPSGDFRNVSTQRKFVSKTFETFQWKENPFWRSFHNNFIMEIKFNIKIKLFLS